MKTRTTIVDSGCLNLTKRFSHLLSGQFLRECFLKFGNGWLAVWSTSARIQAVVYFSYYSRISYAVQGFVHAPHDSFLPWYVASTYQWCCLTTTRKERYENPKVMNQNNRPRASTWHQRCTETGFHQRELQFLFICSSIGKT